MSIQSYITENWDTLPKSTFDGEEVVIFREQQNENYGYGHHSYEGYGIDKEGNLIWAYSSGCSCRGSCGADHTKDAKTFAIEWPEEFSSVDPAAVPFADLQVEFSSY